MSGYRCIPPQQNPDAVVNIGAKYTAKQLQEDARLLLLRLRNS